jgi:hypothetical protein
MRANRLHRRRVPQSSIRVNFPARPDRIRPDKTPRIGSLLTGFIQTQMRMTRNMISLIDTG